MKKFGKLYGEKYTFHGNILTTKKYNQILELSKFILQDKVRITNFKLSKYVKKLENKEELQIIFDEIFEYLLKKYKFDDSKIQNAKKVTKKLYNKLREGNDKNNFLNNIINEEYKIINIYDMIEQRNYKELRKVLNSMHREFLFALYLYYMKR